MQALTNNYLLLLFAGILLLAGRPKLLASIPDTTAIEVAPALDSTKTNGIGAGLNGGLTISNTIFQTSLDSAYRAPFSYLLSGNFNLTWKTFSLPFSFVLSEQERSFRQPFNQFGASPKYKWITLHAGYRNITFSPYTLAGHSFLGGGVELNPGKFRFGAVYGRFVKAIRADSVLILPGESAYDRYALSIKMGVGKPTNFVDFIYLKGWDNPSAILNAEDTSTARPAVNTVLGVTIHQQLGKHFLLKMNTAGSIYTNDIYSASAEVNDNTVQQLINTFNVNTSTQFHYAVDASFGYVSPLFGLSAMYKRISPDYKSMGIYFITNDIEQYTLAPSFKLWKRKVQINGSIGFEHDNLASNRSYQTERLIGSAALNFNPNPVFGLTGSFYNYSVGQIQGIRQLNDTIRLAQVNRGITITPRLTLGKDKLRHMILLTYDIRNLDDQNIYTETYTEYRTATQFLSYAIAHTTQGWSVSMSLNNNKISSELIDTGYKGVSAGATKSFLKGNLNAGFNAGYNIISQNEITGNYLINYNTNISYRFFKNHVFSVYGYSNIYNSKIITSPSYTDYTLRIQYQYLFSKKSII
jgi:hypothetical protein